VTAKTKRIRRVNLTRATYPKDTVVWESLNHVRVPWLKPPQEILRVDLLAAGCVGELEHPEDADHYIDVRVWITPPR
jgi:hypothetical protein